MDWSCDVQCVELSVMMALSGVPPLTLLPNTVEPLLLPHGLNKIQ